MIEGGNTAADGLEIARIMSATGVDAFECSAGNQEKGWNTSFNYFFPKNCIAHLARPVGEAAGKPVIAVGKIHDPLAAEHLLQEGAADFISLGRPFITDPELLIKAREGRYRDIKRCIYCLNCFTYKSRKDRIPRVSPVQSTPPPCARRNSLLPNRLRLPNASWWQGEGLREWKLLILLPNADTMLTCMKRRLSLAASGS